MAYVVLKIHVPFKRAATHLDLVNHHPVRLADTPVSGIETIRFRKDPAIENHKASDLVGHDGFAELGIHDASSHADSIMPCAIRFQNCIKLLHLIP
jgi:hypothetical protein